MPHMNEDAVLRRLQARVDDSGSIRRAALGLGVSYSLVAYVLSRQKAPPPKLLKALGLERVKVSYREVPQLS